jgi:CheY-like chemotaxis protein
MNVPSTAVNSNNAEENSARSVVLVVDDHEDTRGLLRYILEDRGHVVVEAVDGDEAVRTAISKRPDLIIMDVSLKRVDGPEATLRIRSIESLRKVPIIFLSGHAQAQAREAALTSGANDYLVKPVCLDDFEFSVSRFLGAGRERYPEQPRLSN